MSNQQHKESIMNNGTTRQVALEWAIKYNGLTGKDAVEYAKIYTDFLIDGVDGQPHTAIDGIIPPSVNDYQLKIKALEMAQNALVYQALNIEKDTYIENAKAIYQFLKEPAE